MTNPLLDAWTPVLDRQVNMLAANMSAVFPAIPHEAVVSIVRQAAAVGGILAIDTLALSALPGLAMGLQQSDKAALDSYRRVVEPFLSLFSNSLKQVFEKCFEQGAAASQALVAPQVAPAPSPADTDQPAPEIVSVSAESKEN